MISQIFVKDFILIDEVQLSFDDHMSAFTGETGAGKSLLMDAIGVLRGDRINAGMVKEGKQKAIIEGVFEIPAGHIAQQLLADAGFDSEEPLIITREINSDGKSTARINRRITTLASLKEIVSSLVDIHSQHDTQYLLNVRSHISLLDRFCDDEALLSEVKQCWKTFKKLDDERKEALHQDYNEDDLEFLTFQMNEIDDAQLIEGELETLEERLRVMSSYEKISAHIQKACQFLEDDEGSQIQLYEAYREVDAIHEDDIFAVTAEKLLDAYYSIEEASHYLHTYMDQMEYDEALFNEIQDRIYHIRKIFRKYGGQYQEVIHKRTEIEKRIDQILHRQEYMSRQETLCKEAYDAYMIKAETLHKQRLCKAQSLEKAVLQQLQDLMLPNARFQVKIQEIDAHSSGIDRVEFLIAMNAGERLKSLSTTASGGELSRFMLGMKCVFTRLQGIETIIFDEIDTGVSGSVAFAIGKKMQELAQLTQVFCVTHLAAVAACAKQHYIVEKTQADTTHTTIYLLSEQERIAQLANIASNSNSESAIHAAQELYQKAQ